MIGDDGLDLTPPELNRATTATLLNDGERVVASAYANRTVGVPLRLWATSQDNAATAIQNLARELDRDSNILKVQLQGMTSPVFFRTFSSPQYSAAVLRHLLMNGSTIGLSLLAEPFAVGLIDSLGSFTINSDPASGTNPKYADITGVDGDVEAPLLITAPGSSVAGTASLFSVRRGGTPANMPFLQQLESVTQGTDTVVQSNSASYSGSGSNSTRTLFGTTTTLAKRLSFSWPPGTASIDSRGTYRVFARVGCTVNTDDFTLQLRFGNRGIQNDSVAVINFNATATMVDLGLIQIPVGMDPVTLGPTGVPLKVSPSAIPIELWASRDVGSGSLIWDYLLFVPADDRLAIATWGSHPSPSSITYVLDGYADMIYGLDSSGQVADIGLASLAGDVPFVQPNTTNRLFLIRDVNLIAAAGTADPVTGSVAVGLSYYPRYLYVRPATT